MKSNKRKAYKNQRCQECGKPIEEYIERSLSCVKNKEWRVCSECDKKIFGGK